MGKLKLIILTSSISGTAAYITPILYQKGFEISAVLHNDRSGISKRNKIFRIIRKVRKIGILGALNGFRMRSWYKFAKEDILNINLKEFCKLNNIPFESVSSYYNDPAREAVVNSKADLGISLGNGYIPETIFTIPLYGMINIHHEVLPDYKGAQSIIWQIYNGSTITGYSIHRINKKIDHGELVYVEEFSIRFSESLKETIKHNYTELIRNSVGGLTTVLNNFEFYFDRSKNQKGGNYYTTPTYKQFLRMQSNHRKLKALSRIS